MVKRFLLEWGQAKLRKTRDARELKILSALLGKTALRPDQLRLLMKADAKAELPSDTLADAVAKLWKSHGLEGTPVDIVETGLRYPLGTKQLARGYFPLGAAFRLLQTEVIRSVWVEGTIAFLLKGGDPEKIEPANVDHFYELFPWRETTKFSFAPLGIPGIDPEQLLDLLERDPPVIGRDDPSWIKAVIE